MWMTKYRNGENRSKIEDFSSKSDWICLSSHMLVLKGRAQNDQDEKYV